MLIIKVQNFNSNLEVKPMVNIVKPDNKDKIVGIAFTNKDYEGIKKVADLHDMRVSSFIREYIKKTLLKAANRER